MKYIGLQEQQRNNNTRSILLLVMFPVLVLSLVYLFCLLFTWATSVDVAERFNYALQMTLQSSPYVLGGVLLWFLIAYFANTSIIRSATHSHSLERKDNMRVYNLVENLCMAKGMKMPKINVIEDDSLNAFASGINSRTYTVTLTKGIINKLDDDELEGVIAHELSHIRNNDVRLLIVSIVFVGIFAMLAQMSLNAIRYTPVRSRNSNEKNGGGLILLLLLLAIVAGIGYFFSSLMRFAISRKREYLADAGAAEWTRNPLALASALRKISNDPDVEAVKRDDVAQLFIEHPGKHAKGFLSRLGGVFATHPPIKKRIEVLEQF